LKKRWRNKQIGQIDLKGGLTRKDEKAEAKKSTKFGAHWGKKQDEGNQRNKNSKTK